MILHPPVSFAGSVSVLVTIQLMTALAIANLVSRKDAAPSILVAPLDGMVGKVLCLSDMPLIGQVRKHARSMVLNHSTLNA